MKIATYSIIVLLLLALMCNAQTSQTYHETFDNSNDIGWAFLAPNVDFSVQNGELSYASNSDDFVYLFPPMDATKDDFSIEIKPGSSITGIEAGGFGRVGFNSYLAILISDPLFGDSITVIYIDYIDSFEEPNFNILAKYPSPENVNSLRLEANRSGSNLVISASVNGTPFYNGQISNADESLFSGKMMLMIDPEDGEGYKEWALDEIAINYNPMIDPVGSFTDNFNNPNSPWYRYGSIVADQITISNDRLNFNYSGEDEAVLYVMPPVGCVKDFTFEIEVGAGEDHTAPFSISRFIDFKNYITAFFDDEYLVIAYASDSYEPIEIDRKIPDVTNPMKIKFGIEGDESTQNIKVWINDNLLLSGSVDISNNIKLASGHIITGFERGNVINAYMSSAAINYNNIVIEDPGYMNHVTDKLTLSVFPNGLLGHNQNASKGEGLLYENQNDMMWSGGLIFGNSTKGISGMLGSFSLYDMTEKENVSAQDAGNYFDRELTTNFTDENYSGRYGVEVFQNSLSRIDKDIIFITYRVINVSGVSLDDFYVGMFADFDISNYEENLNGYDQARNLVYQYEPNSQIHFGLVALNGMTGGKAATEDTQIRQELFNIMTNTDYTASSTKGDYRSFISTGPASISSQAETVVTFAIIAADNYNNLLATADDAKNIYNSQFVSVEEHIGSLPAEYLLYQNYPNPFNPVSNIKYQIVNTGHVNLAVYDMLGREVMVLVNKVEQPGNYEVTFDGSGLASGVYLYKLNSGQFVQTMKLMLLK